MSTSAGAKCQVTWSGGGDVSPNGTFIYSNCETTPGECHGKKCAFACLLKFSNTETGGVIPCPHIPCENNPTKLCIDYEALKTPEWEHSECALWHGGNNISWSSSDPNNTPAAGVSEHRFQKKLRCEPFQDNTYSVTVTATSGKSDSGGHNHVISATVDLTCHACANKKPPPPPPPHW